MPSNINAQTHTGRDYFCPQFIVAVLGLLPNETKKLGKADQMKNSCIERR